MVHMHWQNMIAKAAVWSLIDALTHRFRVSCTPCIIFSLYHMLRVSHTLSLVNATFSGRKQTLCTFLCNLCVDRMYNVHVSCYCIQFRKENTSIRMHVRQIYIWCHQNGSIPTKCMNLYQKKFFMMYLRHATSKLPKINIVNQLKLRLDYRLKRSDPRNHKPLSFVRCLSLNPIRNGENYFWMSTQELIERSCEWCHML